MKKRLLTSVCATATPATLIRRDKNSRAATLEAVKDAGFTPCSRCAY